jgi:hypothetical protein
MYLRTYKSSSFKINKFLTEITRLAEPFSKCARLSDRFKHLCASVSKVCSRRGSYIIILRWRRRRRRNSNVSFHILPSHMAAAAAAQAKSSVYFLSLDGSLQISAQHAIKGCATIKRSDGLLWEGSLALEHTY